MLLSAHLCPAAVGCSDSGRETVAATVHADRAPVTQELEPGVLTRIDRREDRSRLGFVASWTRGPDVERWAVLGYRAEFEALVVPGRGPAIVLLPHLDGFPALTEILTNRLGRAGWQVVAILPPAIAMAGGASPREWAELLRRRVRDGRLAVRVATDVLGASCVLLVGHSIGAMAALPVAALEPGVRGIATIAGGGDLFGIVRDSSNEDVAALRARSLAGLAAEASDIEPLSWTGELQRLPILLIRPGFDRVVPSASSLALRAALPHSEELVLPAGHYSSMLFLPQILARTLEHGERVCSRDTRTASNVNR